MSMSADKLALPEVDLCSDEAARRTLQVQLSLL